MSFLEGTAPAAGDKPQAQANAQAAGQAAATAAPPSWIENLPEDLRAVPSLTKFNSLESLARGYINAERMIGGDKIPVPKDPNDQAAWDNWYKAAGRPDTPVAYEVQRPEKLPEGVTYDEQMEEWFRVTAHKAGLNKNQFKSLYEAYRDRVIAAQEAGQASASQETMAARLALQRDWGDKFELQMRLANAEFESLPQATQARIRASGLNRDPGFIKHLASARARGMGETESRMHGHGGPTKTPDQITSEIADLRGRYGDVLLDKSHPEHGLRVKQLTELFDQLYPPSRE